MAHLEVFVDGSACGLKFPTGLCLFEEADEVRAVVCDGSNGRIVTWHAGMAHVLASGLEWPYDVCRSPCNGGLLVAEECGNCVSSLSSPVEVEQGAIVCFGNADHSRGHGLGELNRPYSLCSTPDGSVLIADKDNNRLLRWQHGQHEGVVIAGGHGRGFEINQLSLPSHVAVSPLDGTVAICDMCNARIIGCNVDGTNLRVLAGGGPFDKGNGPRQLDQPFSLCFGPEGALYVNDSGNERIQRFAPGSVDGETILDDLGSTTHGICVDSQNRLYVVISGEHRVLRISPSSSDSEET